MIAGECFARDIDDWALLKVPADDGLWENQHDKLMKWCEERLHKHDYTVIASGQRVIYFSVYIKDRATAVEFALSHKLI